MSYLQDVTSIDDWRQLANSFTPSDTNVLLLYSSQSMLISLSAIATNNLSNAIKLLNQDSAYDNVRIWYYKLDLTPILVRPNRQSPTSFFNPPFQIGFYIYQGQNVVAKINGMNVQSTYQIVDEIGKARTPAGGGCPVYTVRDPPSTVTVYSTMAATATVTVPQYITVYGTHSSMDTLPTPTDSTDNPNDPMATDAGMRRLRRRAPQNRNLFGMGRRG
ncbi:hypothetical protein TWF694_010206 [Orbilia ellipsospora]|uniref:Uncharacterized protein n=1 Tax=Orbilia ellipsospora TaxID=2528407 RepID=A0AAV9X965_9PEZI